jgi:hypothetical protein
MLSYIHYVGQCIICQCDGKAIAKFEPACEHKNNVCFRCIETLQQKPETNRCPLKCGARQDDEGPSVKVVGFAPASSADDNNPIMRLSSFGLVGLATGLDCDTER